MDIYKLINPAGREVEMTGEDVVILALRGAFTGYTPITPIPVTLFENAIARAKSKGNAARLRQAADIVGKRSVAELEGEVSREREARIAAERALAELRGEEYKEPETGVDEIEEGADSGVGVDESDDLAGPDDSLLEGQKPATKGSYRGGASRK